jgi:hypothetical protein
MTRHSFDLATSHLSAVHRFTGTITDLSVLGRLTPDEISEGPYLSAAALAWLRYGIENRVWDRSADGKTVFARDGKKVLSFATAYHMKQQAILQETIMRTNEESAWMLTKFITRLLINTGEKETKRELVEMANYELTENEWADISANGCGFVRRTATDTRTDDMRAYVKAFLEARDNMAENLERLWSELFAEHGVKGAIEIVRGMLVPESEEAKAAINQAFLRAKDKFKS